MPRAVRDVLDRVIQRRRLQMVQRSVRAPQRLCGKSYADLDPRVGGEIDPSRAVGEDLDATFGLENL